MSGQELKRIFSLARPERWRLAAALGLLFVSSAVTMTVPFALGRIIDVIYDLDQLKQTDLEQQKCEIRSRLKTVCLGLTGVFLLGGLCNFGRVFLMRVSGQNIAARLRSQVYSAILRQETAFFDKTRTGELINRLSADSQLVSLTLTQQVSDGLRSCLMTGAGVGMMLVLCPKLAGVGLAVVPPASVLAVLMGRRVKAISKELQDSLAATTELAEEKISNIRTVRVFGKEKTEIAAYQQRVQAVLATATREALVNAQFYGLTGLTGNMIIITTLYYGGTLVTQGDLSVGNLASFVLYSAYVGIGLSGVSSFYAEVMKGLGASSRLWQLVDRLPVGPARGGLVPSQDLPGNISFSEVSFAYPSRPDQHVLRGLSLEIPANSSVALVGASGCGKSTLASLLVRLYEPDSGQIRVDGVELARLDPTFLRRYIGTVPQEPVLFCDTVRNNILYGSPDPTSVTDEELVAAASEANAHEFILGLGSGYDTVVGERGVLLSGGQRQRIALARALVSRPRVLLLDEATSALDSQAEEAVREAVARVMRGRTVLTIAHRLSTIRCADLVAVLQDGRVVEQGSYTELARKQRGIFAQLVRQQQLDS